MRKRLVLLFVSIFILVGCGFPAFKKDNPIGKTYRDVFVLENKRVPLLEGEWKVAGTGYNENENYCEVILIKETSDCKMAGGIIITSDTITNSYSGYKPSEYAKRTDLHSVSINANTMGKGLDLWLINHYYMQVSPNREALKEFFHYCLDNKIELPKLMIQSYHLMTGKNFKGKYLLVAYYYNPAVEGFDTSIEKDWANSSWHPLRISADPKKQMYIERIKKEGELLHGKIQGWFDY